MPEERQTVVKEEEHSDEGQELRECSNCRWWCRARPLPETIELWGMEMFAFGECRAVPPTTLGSDKKLIAQNDPEQQTHVFIKLARFPHTYNYDWCGMWEAKT